MIKTGKLKTLARFILLFAVASTAQASIHATVDRAELPVDESISLKISVSGDPSGDAINPKFDAPDFEIMNQFQNSQYSSIYVNGRWETKNENSITFILRPLRVGALKIRNIHNKSDRAPDITVQVVQENLYRKSAPGDAPALKGDAKNFFVKAEVSKARAYKGEQLVVSYYLFRRTRASVRDVMQYPSFQGFIREDLEMPILSGRPDFEAVNLGGIPFERALLARYAIYPIKDGKLKIDGFSVRVDYIPKNNGNDDLLEDPFFQFFTQVTPRTGTAKSDPLTIDVLPLPEDGKTSLFTGGVGDFEVSAQVDQSNVKANAPLVLKVTVRGRGNGSLVEFPQINWPPSLKFYEAQGKSKNLGQGNSEKTFEVVLVPLQKGQHDIPPIEFEFFNPDTRSYVRKKTQSIPIQVAEGDPGSAPQFISRGDSESKANEDAPTQEGFGSLRVKDKASEVSSGFLGQPWWRWVAWFGLLVFFCFIGLIVWDQMKKRSLAQLEILRRKQNADAFWKSLETEAEKGKPGRILERVVEECYKTLDETYNLSSRAMPNRELERTLVESHGFSQELWQELLRIFEFSEMVRFSPDSEDPTLINRVTETIRSARKLCSEISRKKIDKSS